MFIYINDIPAVCITYGMFISDMTNIINDTPAFVQSVEWRDLVIIVHFQNGNSIQLSKDAHVKEFEEI